MVRPLVPKDVMRTFGTVGVALGIVVLGVTWVSAQGDPGRTRNGQLIYEDVCYRCHGPNGEGNGPDADRLIVRPANLQSPQSRSKSEFELLTAVSYGIAFSPMHAWRGKLSDEEMLEVIRYIRQLAPYNPAL
jgi:cytochrome c oxidase cbb3-type subunit 3